MRLEHARELYEQRPRTYLVCKFPIYALRAWEEIHTYEVHTWRADGARRGRGGRVLEACSISKYCHVASCQLSAIRVLTAASEHDSDCDSSTPGTYTMRTLEHARGSYRCLACLGRIHVDSGVVCAEGGGASFGPARAMTCSQVWPCVCNTSI